MEALRVAHAFGRADVDAFLAEVDHEQFAEWASYLALEPHGWNGTQILGQRLSYWIAQSQTRKRLKERDFEIRLGGGVTSDATEKARWEAMSIRSGIEEDLRAQHG